MTSVHSYWSVLKMVSQKDELAKLRNRISSLESSNSSLKAKQKKLYNVAKEILDQNKALWKEVNFLRSKGNSTNYHCDAVEQYGRKENSDWHEIIEKENETEKDVIDAVVERANYVLSKSTRFSNTTVDASDIQRCHRVGKKKESQDPNTPPKPRKIICRFKSYKLRQKIILSKKHLKSSPNYSNCFITENLTPFRAKLLWYVKNKCDGRFVNAHTRNGNINVQLCEAHGEDDKWYIIKSPEDLFSHGINVDLKCINEKYLSFQVHAQLDVVPIFNRYEELLSGIDADS